jgi:hypothetical protein
MEIKWTHNIGDIWKDTKRMRKDGQWIVQLPNTYLVETSYPKAVAQLQHWLNLQFRNTPIVVDELSQFNEYAILAEYQEIVTPDYITTDTSNR